MMDAIRLEDPFSIEEVKKAVWAYGGDKSPGPDKLTFKFIKEYWSFMASDIIKFVQHFDTHSTLGHGCNSSHITLAPTMKDPATLNEYRPISLIGCM